MFTEERDRQYRPLLKKKSEVGERSDFVEEGLYDVFWALVVAVRERLCHEFLVYGRDVRHVVAGR